MVQTDQQKQDSYLMDAIHRRLWRQDEDGAIVVEVDHIPITFNGVQATVIGVRIHEGKIGPVMICRAGDGDALEALAEGKALNGPCK